MTLILVYIVYFRMVFSSFDVSFYVSNIKNAISFWRLHLVFKMQLDRLWNEHIICKLLYFIPYFAHSIFCSLSNCIIFFIVILIHYPFSNTLFSQLTNYQRPLNTDCIFHITIKRNTTLIPYFAAYLIALFFS